MCEPMGRREIFLTFSLLVETEGHFTNELVSYVYETEDSSFHTQKNTFSYLALYLSCINKYKQLEQFCGDTNNACKLHVYTALREKSVEFQAIFKTN
jgi:hypothetical protein